jgi:hypothetical protein
MTDTVPTSSVVRKMLDPPESSWRGRMRTALMTVTILLFVGLIAVCGFSAWYFQPVLSESPQLARDLTEEMLRVQVPEEFEARGAIEWNLLWLVEMRGTYYELTGEDGLLMFLDIESSLMDEPDIRDHVERTLREKGAGGPPLKIVEEEPDREFDVRGRIVSFRTRIGESPADRSRHRLCEGVVDGNRGPVLVAFRLPETSAEHQRENESLIERTILQIR